MIQWQRKRVKRWGLYTESQKVTKRYLNSPKNLSICVKPEEADRLKNEANKRNMSLRSFILLAVNEKIEREAIKNSRMVYVVRGLLTP